MRFKTLIRLGLVTLIAGTLAGCGSDGSNGSAGAPGATGATGPAGPAGQNAVATVNAATLTPDQWANLKLQGQVTGVTIASAPVVKFKVTDVNGNPVIGLALKDSTGVYPNFSFGIAKLMPADATTKAPSRWVNYNVFAVPPVDGKTPALLFPEPEHSGSMQDNLDGTYTYTFGLDITKAKGYVDSVTVDAAHVKADLDDLTYVSTLPHRLIISVGGSLPGDTAQTQIGKSANLSYDFIPSTGNAVTVSDPQRDIVSINKCNECHDNLTLHEPRIPGMHDPKLCVVCHTDQVKYGSGEAVPASGNVLVPAGDYAAYGATMKVHGFAAANFPNMVHKIHMGEELYYQGYNQFGVKYNETTYPQPITNCVKCHDGSATSTAKTASGDNWKNAPSRLACGACHDGINFATGGGTTLNGVFTGHVGGAKADDSQCALCHGATDISLYHVTVDPALSAANSRAWYNAPWGCSTAVGAVLPCTTVNQVPAAASLLGNLPSDVHKVSLEIKQVTVAGAAGSKQASVVFRINIDGAPATINSTAGTMLFNNIDGSPTIYVAYAIPQDGIAAPADWNANVFDSVRDIRDGKTMTTSECSSNALSSVKTTPTLSAPDASGYYTATLGCVIPDSAKMVTAALGINYPGLIQLDAAAYPKGILLRESQFAMKLADGYTARRTIVSNAKCNKCHGQLGILPTFHGGARNNGEGCAICHSANNATGHTGAANSFGGGWNVGIKNLVHSIHASAKRAQPFTYEATAANPNGFQEVTYPGVLKDCEQCHVAGSYDFSATANNAALPNLLWTTDAKADMTNPTSAPSIGLSPWVTIQGKGQANYTDAGGTAPNLGNLVTSPIAAACFGCHDSTLAVAHMESNGGTIVRLFSSVASVATRPAIGAVSTMTFTKQEQCTICHGSGKVADIKAMHAQ